MNDMTPNMGEVSLRRRSRPPVEDVDSSIEDQDLQEVEQSADAEGEPDDGSDMDMDSDMDSDMDLSSGEEDREESEEDAPEAGAATSSTRLENVKVGLRRLSAERCILGIDIDLAFDAPEPGAETGDDEPEAQEYSFDADDLDAMLAEPPRRKAAPMAAPAGRAGAALMSAKAQQPKPRAKLKIDRKKFFQAYNATFGKLDRKQMQGLHALLAAAEADPHLTDIRWLAYMLATVQHECGGRWRPIREFTRGKGMKYGKPVVVKDPQGKKYRNVYYGRGYVQLTWDFNYRKMGKLLKNRLLYEPDLALRPSVAYKIMSEGMRRGTFTQRKLSDYIHGKKADYVGARWIINGTDRNVKIARNAVKLEKILRRSVVRAAA